MKNMRSVLEYHAVRTTQSKKARWTYRFCGPDGEVLLQSAKLFGSKAQAERGFVSVIKSVAANSYTVEFTEQVQDGFDHGPVLSARRNTRGLARKSGNRLLKYI